MKRIILFMLMSVVGFPLFAGNNLDPLKAAIEELPQDTETVRQLVKMYLASQKAAMMVIGIKI